ncbi:hypothetical protein JEQ12_001154 [Ovis aries]|uniref:Uncharacterized protein n=1 Tax=Ovis aries TaxID=9940 RepID=A0A836AJ87_SHEEP|nr:hypothetical protein JEQ12_001154 [Ovis aries]
MSPAKRHLFEKELLGARAKRTPASSHKGTGDWDGVSPGSHTTPSSQAQTPGKPQMLLGAPPSLETLSTGLALSLRLHLHRRGSRREQRTSLLPQPLAARVSSPSTEAEAKPPSPTVALPTFSSSLQHSSPHTISFRMSPRRDSSEAALTRSTSMRLPASSVKLGLKVEQYLSAIQRSESIRYANPFHTEFPVAPVDVTSKCHLFEKEQVGQSQEDPASSCKENLRLSGVKSRLNLWMSRAQESAQQGPQNQETQRELEAGSKPQWRKTPEALLGAEKISVLEERAVSGKRAVPDKASDSEKRPVSEKATVFEKTPVPEMQPAPGRAMAPVWPQDWEHSASAEYPSSPTRQRGTGPEKEPESSAGPLSRAGGLPPVTLQREEEAMSDVEERVDEYDKLYPACWESPHILSQAYKNFYNWLRILPHNEEYSRSLKTKSHTAAAKHANDLEASGKMQTWIYSKGFRLAMGAALKDQDCKDKSGYSKLSTASQKGPRIIVHVQFHYQQSKEGKNQRSIWILIHDEYQCEEAKWI